MRKLLMAATAVCALTALPDSDAEASIVDNFPDVIVCNIVSGPSTGPAVFRLVAKQVGDGDRLIYRLPNPDTRSQVKFNPDGSFSISENISAPTDCENQSLQQIEAAGNARFFAESSTGADLPAGAMTYFNLAACPGGWTQQVQLDPVSTPDQPMVLCRKD